MDDEDKRWHNFVNFYLKPASKCYDFFPLNNNIVLIKYTL